MNRAVLNKTNIIIAAIVAVIGLSAGTALVVHSHSDAQLVTNAQHQLTEISYHGQNGVDALTLLKQHATVSTKHYSFGDLVVSINGTAGSGPKYWTFYVNGKMAQVGAGAYATKDADALMWKLQ
jgi:hypothetical protein